MANTTDDPRPRAVSDRSGADASDSGRGPSRPTPTARLDDVGGTGRAHLRRRGIAAILIVIAATLTSAATVGAQPADDTPAALSDTEVARLFDVALPALSDPPPVPTVLGDPAADARIAAVAEARGYRPRGSPLDALGFYQGRRLQPRAIADLQALQAAMAAEIGATLTLTSAHRDVGRQRAIFMERLRDAALRLRGRPVGAAEIARGDADDVLHATMGTAAPPGFSKHHTGYAIDVASDGLGGHAFARSRAYAWLTADGYANAMRFGWIPSYPPRAAAQGPEPEPWEWVWIGRSAAACARERTCLQGDVSLAPAGRRVLVHGWALGERRPVRAVRVVTSGRTRTLRAQRIDRFDVEAVLGGADTQVGFAVRLRVPRSTTWACVEMRPRRGAPWQRLDCTPVTMGTGSG